MLPSDMGQVRDPSGGASTSVPPWVAPDPATLLERVSDACVALDRDWRYVYVNAQAAALFARTPSDLLGKHIWTEFPEGVGQPFHLAYERALEEQQPLQLEAYYGPWDRWFENRVFPSPDGLLIFFHEVTDRVRAQRSLAESEGRLRAALTAARARVFEWDLGTGAVIAAGGPLASRGARAQGRGGEATFEGPIEAFLELEDPPSGAPLGAALRDAVGEQEPFTKEVRLSGAPGAPGWLAVSGSVDRSDEGEPLRVRGTLQDVTRRKRAELAERCQSEVLGLLASGASLGEVLEALARGVEAQLTDVWCSILLLDPDRLHVRHGAAPSLPPAYARAIDGAAIGLNAGTCGAAAARGEVVYTEDITTDPLWADYRALAATHGLRACWSSPIKDAGGRVSGTFALYGDRPRLPGDFEKHLVAMATHTAGIAIRAEEARSSLRSLGARLLSSQDQERRRIARELHDTTVQNLAALGMNLAVVQQRVGEDSVLLECHRLVDQSAAELRTLAYVLHPPLLEDFGVVRAVREFVEGFSRRSGIDVDLSVDDAVDRPARDVELALFRVLQEALNNVHRHSGSATATVRLTRSEGAIVLEVEDQGSGFEGAEHPESLPAGGLGLMSMGERLRAIGGHLEVVAGPHGVRVVARAPAGDGGP